MKKFLSITFLFALVLLIVPVLAFAQDAASPIDKYLVLIDTFLYSHFLTLLASVPLVLLVSGWIINATKLQGDWPRRIVSWIVAIAFAFIGYWRELGIYAGDISILDVILYGLSVGAAANGFYTISWVKAIIDSLGGLTSRKEKQEVVATDARRKY